jgi:anthranilate phosphoribosyltransferase
LGKTNFGRRQPRADNGEIAAFDSWERSIQPALDRRAPANLDVRTGGDRLNTFNISTTVAVVAAAAGVLVANTATAPSPPGI